MEITENEVRKIVNVKLLQCLAVAALIALVAWDWVYGPKEWEVDQDDHTPHVSVGF